MTLMLKFCASFITDLLVHIFITPLVYGICTEIWKYAVTIQIHKMVTFLLWHITGLYHY